MTMSKIAKLSGCSLSTVSKAFRNSPEISESTKEKIFKIARENNCFTKYYSPVYKKRVFAVICNELISSVYGVMVDTINNKITANGDTLLISSCNFISANLEDLFDYYVNYHKIDGLIVIGKLPESVKTDNKILSNTPLVCIRATKSKASSPCDCVESDRDPAIVSAVNYFKEMGHKKIAFIGEYLTSSAQKRFIEAMTSAELEVKKEWIICSSKRKAEAGVDGMERLLSLPERPTAIFAAYDAIAFGAINKIHRVGLSVPKDFSIISSDNIPLSQFSSPSLTTIADPVEDIAEGAINLLYRRLNNSNAPFQRIQIQSELIIRNSVEKIGR